VGGAGVDVEVGGTTVGVGEVTSVAGAVVGAAVGGGAAAEHATSTSVTAPSLTRNERT
jgi:hypothetical protein